MSGITLPEINGFALMAVKTVLGLYMTIPLHLPVVTVAMNCGPPGDAVFALHRTVS